MRTVIIHGELLKKRERSILFHDMKTKQDLFIPLKTIVSWGIVGRNDRYHGDICDDDSMEDILVWVEIPTWLAKRELLV